MFFLGSTPRGGREFFHVTDVCPHFSIWHVADVRMYVADARWGSAGGCNLLGSSRWAIKIEIRNFSEVGRSIETQIADSQRVFSHGCLEMSRRCIEIVWMPNSCCTFDQGGSVPKINKSMQELGQLFKTKNGGWRQRTEAKMSVSQLRKSKLMRCTVCFRCWPVRADIKNTCYGRIIHCKLLYIYIYIYILCPFLV